MKILSVNQVRQFDAYTIKNEPISSLDLMERASRAFVTWFSAKFPVPSRPVFVCCGPGNNGGDGLVIARLLSQQHYDVKVFLAKNDATLSPDCQTNLERLLNERCCPLEEIDPAADFPILEDGAVLIDALFGSGLSRPIDGFWKNLIDHLNRLNMTKVAVDIPSGMFADQVTTGHSFLADFTFTFEVPKLGFLFPENSNRVGDWEVGSIGLHGEFLEKVETPSVLIGPKDIRPLLPTRQKYAHKGTFGHALLVAGAYGTVGAALLSARAILRSGAGLVSVHAPKCAYTILQMGFPEAMVSVDKHDFVVTNLPANLTKYNAIGIGCGLGTNILTLPALEKLLEKSTAPLVLDADALNLLAQHRKVMKKIPKRSILTPHPKEFERLFGKSSNSFERNQLQREKAKELGIYIILKGAHTCIASPEGYCYFNTTGNPGMATGGSGDVLTGILTGLLSQGIQEKDAALLGVYLHGLAGDLARKAVQQEALLASDIIDHLGQAFERVRSEEGTNQ